jgi:hypothetical protein
VQRRFEIDDLAILSRARLPISSLARCGTLSDAIVLELVLDASRGHDDNLDS